MSGFPYKKILVLGATSGIGKALAVRFVQEGKHVIAVGRRQEQLDELVKEQGDQVTSYAFDSMSDAQDLRTLLHSLRTVTKLAEIPAFAKE